MSAEIKILDIFVQPECSEHPTHYAVQYVREGETSVDYQYFSSESEAIEAAKEHGYEEDL